MENENLRIDPLQSGPPHEADLIGVGRYAGFRFPREPLEEVNDLPMALRKELIWCDRHQDIDGFALFDTSHRADAKSIRRSVNNKLKLFHPDTYFEHAQSRYPDEIALVYC